MFMFHVRGTASTLFMAISRCAEDEMSSFQQRPISSNREEFEMELRDLLTKDVRGTLPSPTELKKADDLISKILALADRYAFTYD